MLLLTIVEVLVAAEGVEVDCIQLLAKNRRVDVWSRLRESFER